MMIPQNIKDAVIEITKPLSPEAVNDIFYKIVLEKNLNDRKRIVKTEEGRIQNR